MDSRSPVLVGTVVGCFAGVAAFLVLGQDNAVVLNASPVGTNAQTSIVSTVAVPQYTAGAQPQQFASVDPASSIEDAAEYVTPVVQAKSWTAVLAGALAIPLAAAGLLLLKNSGRKEERVPLVSIDDLMTVGKQALVTTAVVGAATMADGASAYPIFAQQGFANPREATGRIVCANCHLASKQTEIEMPQAVLPDQVFEAVTKVPYSGVPSLSQSVMDPNAVVGSVTFQGAQPVSFQQESGIPVSQAMVEFDAPTTANTVFKATIKVPYDMSLKQPSGGGKPSELNVGAVVILPEGFTLAPKERIPESMKKEINGLTFTPYSKTQPNILVVGPVAGKKYEEMHVALLSPDPATNKNVHFGTQSVFVGGNRGRGQLYPDGSKSNNNSYEAVKSGKIVDIELDEKKNVYTIAVEEKGTKLVSNETLPAGAKLIVKKGDVIKAGDTITANPNVGGFGQAETEIVLQDPGRVKALLFFSFTVLATQTMLVVKKKQYEQVQLAEMDF